VYTSARIDKALSDNRDGTATGSITGVKSLTDIKTESTNGYLKYIAKNDFEKFPSSFTQSEIIMLLSTNGAAYTAKSNEFKLDADKRMLISFFVKTSEVIAGRSGASITLVDGENKTTISAFDSTTVDTVDIDDTTTDIYDGWVQCFFFVSNDTKEEKSFHLEFSLGPTSIASSDKYAYGQGYAAFANFETKTLTKTELSYASTGDRAKKGTRPGLGEATTVFDTATASSDIKTGLGTPVNFTGMLAGSNQMVSGSEIENNVPAGVATGLLNYNYVKDYDDNTTIGSLFNGKTEEAWKAVFGDKNNRTALQPLVIMNTDDGEAKPSYGYRTDKATISASSYQKISLRVKLSGGAKATVYLTDVCEFSNAGYNKFLKPGAPKVTYW
ncbi:MAG: hypothetical protein K2N18_05610, partial [Clostridia bacterium]|nr:hypothetical protein [Clostridia bacterium]